MTKFLIKGSMIGANSIVPRLLDISNNEMVMIGPTIQEFYMMKVFDCSNNNLTTLPEEFESLQSLEKLDASKNRLMSLPFAMSSLRNLKIMLLSDNSLPSISNEICSLKDLRVLDVRNNKIRSLPIEFGSMPQLYDFRALGNPFESPNIAVFSSGQNALNYSRAMYGTLITGKAMLAEFRLAVVPLEVNKINSVSFASLNCGVTMSFQILHVANLQSADFHGNQLTFVSEHIFAMATLVSLNFSKNNIAHVSEEISKLTNLTSIDFSENAITCLCPEIGSISGLLQLNLSKNPLVTPNRAVSRTSAENVASYMKGQWAAIQTCSLELLHMGISVLSADTLSMTGLQSLNLSHNSFSVFPVTNYHHLVTLNLSKNDFSEVPRTVGALRSLRKLDISECRCKLLPSIWKNCKMIQALVFSRNCLSEANEGFFREFDALTELDVSFNQNLHKIDRHISVLTSLVILDVSGTAIDSFELHHGDHPRLQNLKLNSMIRLQTKNIDCNFDLMTSLEVLGIGGECINHPLEDHFSSLTNLKEFSLSGSVTCVPYTIARSQNLRMISVIHCNNLQSPCQNIVEAGASAMIKYLQILWNSGLNEGFLNLSAMQINSSIANFAYMEHLVHADFSDNLLTSCNFFGPSLTNLRSLNIARNNLTSVSETISRLTALKTLLLDSNVLESLPDTIGQCHSLNYVSMFQNPIKMVPLALGKCKFLNRVYVDQTRDTCIQNFPEDIQGDRSQFFRMYLNAHDQVYTNHVNETTFRQEQYEFSVPAIGLMHIPTPVLILTKLQRLNFSLNTILRIPEDVFLMVDLVELNLNFCGLALIPNMINKLTNIVHLCLAGNRLVTFDVNLTPMTSIQKLWLQDNQLAKVTKTLERCFELRSIILRNNRLKTIPLKMWKLRFLSELGLEGNPDLEVPPAELVANMTLIQICGFLKAFDEAADIGIFDGASLKMLSFPIGTLRIGTLTNLSIRDNAIMRIPDEISCIKNLIQFDMRQNPCKRLPPTLCTLSIVKLFLDQETFTFPPPLILSQGLQKINWFLRKFYAARLTGKVTIRDVKLSIFEFFEGDFDDIKTFDVKAARIQEIPAGIKFCTTLTDLQLNDNHISLISDDCCECWSLRRISLCNNRISQNMNTNIANLQLLSEIDFSGNFLSTVPEALYRIQNIQNINISNNRIAGFKVPSQSWKTLTQLNLSNNMFTALPLSLFDVVSIKILQVSNNAMSHLQQQFNFFQNIVELDVSSNVLESVEGLKYLYNLKSLNASKNKITSLSHNFGGFSELLELHLEDNPLDFPPIEVTSTGSQNTLALMRQFFEGCKNGSMDVQSFKLRSLSVQLLSMDHLLVLNARNNSIFIIPPQISFLTTLQELYLDDNRIGCIPVHVSTFFHFFIY
jgi:Leucine-rich repeat (LRR) protein